MEKNNGEQTRCGYIALIGRPNVGKSTLLNHILGEKLSIISPKPQTTRHRILGIKTEDNDQMVYVDTPGLHEGEKRAINRYMNRTVRDTLKDVDVVVFIVEALKWTEEDEKVLTLIAETAIPVLLVINKIDTVKDKTKLLPFLEKVSKRLPFAEIIPLSAMQGENVNALEQKLKAFLPENPHFFPKDQITDQNMLFRVSEIIREKLMIQLQEELPYGIAVEIEMMQKEETGIFISAIIWVEKKGQKPIVIGKEGKMLKRIGIQARQDLELLLNEHIHLKLWVKIKDNWSDDERILRNLGYIDLN